jgi:hypothetical protein
MARRTITITKPDMPIPTTTNIFVLGERFFRAASLSAFNVFIAFSAGVLPFLAGSAMLGEVTGL